jgi:hypothetical protein
VRSVPIEKDQLVLSYIPDWAHGRIDNLAVASNGGGVRALFAWPRLDDGELAGKRMLDAVTGPLSSGTAGDDAAEADVAADDIAFKPNCLGMQTSIDVHPVRLRASCPSKP